MSEDLENKPTEVSEPEVSTETTEPISLSDAMTGIFTEPGETFSAMKLSKKNFWLVPIIIFIVFSIVSRYMVTNDEELYSEIKTKQIESIKKRFDEQIKEGKMSQEQANEKMEQVSKGFSKSSPIFIVSLTLAPAVITFIILFLKGLIIFGVLKLFKGVITYMQVIAVLGIASIIDTLQTIIDTVLAIVTGRLLANIGPILIFPKDSLSDKMSILLAHFDLFNIWYVILIGIGFAAYSNLKSKQTIPIVFALWLIWVCMTAFLNISFLG